MQDDIIFDRKELKEALRKAKELEKEPITSNEELVKLYQENMERSEELKKLLKKEWFVHDTDIQSKMQRKKTKGSVRRKNL
ncbi:MAG: hypothetical protein HY363_01260 [Candidatus Aenigmarchaeota archaeon]|nr:hypothetical protein [Candidatus Aenigmarchaeota archaeon]